MIWYLNEPVNRFVAELDILPEYNTNAVYASNQVLIE